MFYSPNIHRCEHIKVNGTQCGSPSLRHKRLCFFHARWQEQRLAIADAAPGAGTGVAPALNLPALEDANSIQVAIMQTLNLLLTGQVEHKTAALTLYGLQTASSNLRHTRFEPCPRDVVINLTTVGRTILGEEAWKNSDFKAAQNDEEAAENDRSKTEEGSNYDKGDDVAKRRGHDAPAPNSQEDKPVRALREHSAPMRSEGTCDTLPPNWKEELRSKIAAAVHDATLEGTWVNELIQSAETDQ